MKIIFFALITGTLLCSSVYSQNTKDLKFINNTGITISKVYMSYHNSNKWGSNLLTTGKISDKQSYQIDLRTTDPRCFWDFKVDDSNNNEYMISNVNICNMKSVVAIKSGTNITFENLAQRGKKDSGLKL